MTELQLEKLWRKAIDLSSQAPHVYSSPYYALKGAAEQVAETLSKKDAKTFMEYAYERYKNASNYAGD